PDDPDRQGLRRSGSSGVSRELSLPGGQAVGWRTRRRSTRRRGRRGRGGRRGGLAPCRRDEPDDGGLPGRRGDYLMASVALLRRLLAVLPRKVIPTIAATPISTTSSMYSTSVAPSSSRVKPDSA